MRTQSLKRRLAALECQAQPSGGYAVQLLDTPGDEPIVWVGGVEMPLSVFRVRYPHGQIVKTLARALWEAL